MFSAVYTGLTGLKAYSNGLNSISHNVGNLNTPGYKSNELLFRDTFYEYRLIGDYREQLADAQIGNGVLAENTNIRFMQGEIRQTGNQTDVAIQGNGFFVLREDGATYYTRVGQFEFDEDGYLIARGTSARVAGIDGAGNLADINITGLRVDPAKATSEVNFVNNLSTGSARHSIPDVTVYDALGDKHSLTVVFINNKAVRPGSWLVEVHNEQGDVIAKGEIRFQPNGSPEVDYNTFQFSFAPGDAPPSEIVFDFGEPGTFSGATSFLTGTISDLAVSSQDGYGLGSMMKVSFDTDGTMILHYSNGQTHECGQLALAWRSDLQALRQLGDGRFLALDPEAMYIAPPQQDGMGEIVGESIELSNVELTQEFTDLIVMQRGYQASSQIITTANEMMQQLLDMVRRR